MMVNQNWRNGTEVLTKYLDEYAELFSIVFKDPPWQFNWHLLSKNDPGSPHNFLKMLIGYGAIFLELRKENSNILVGFGIVIENLTEEALNGGLADLKTYGNASSGDAYLAGTAVKKEYRGNGYGKILLDARLERIGLNKRCVLRTQEKATEVVTLATSAGMRICARYRYCQAGVNMERVIFERAAS